MTTYPNINDWYTTSSLKIELMKAIKTKSWKPILNLKISYFSCVPKENLALKWWHPILKLDIRYAILNIKKYCPKNNDSKSLY